MASLDDDFVDVSFDQERTKGGKPNDAPKPEHFAKQWFNHGSAKFVAPELFGFDALRKQYPTHAIVGTQDYNLNPLRFPGASITPLENTPLIVNTFYNSTAYNTGLPGSLGRDVLLGTFSIDWDKYHFLMFTVKFSLGFTTSTQTYILHDGPEDPIRTMLLATGLWSDRLHDEVWVFNQGFWGKDHALWTEIQKADWKDVILKEDFKTKLRKDVDGFFASEAIYKKLAIPWKRGLILYGPPGNGKTISLKAILKSCGAAGHTPLLVKSFQSYKGEEGAMADVFAKARQTAPSVLILEDLDSLINDRNRSFFLNQMDGLEGNDGLLVIGSTNHFERLDPGLSTRPSRFDRKFKFDDPDREERLAYALYWQEKLSDNKDIDFPDRLVGEFADLTDQFSFAYLKEAFVSSLVMLASYEGVEKPTFETVLKEQVEVLRQQLNKSSTASNWTFPPRHNPFDNLWGHRSAQFKKQHAAHTHDHNTSNTRSEGQGPREETGSKRDFRSLLDALSEVSEGRPRHGRTERDIRSMLQSLSENLARTNIGGSRSMDYAAPRQEAPQAGQEDYRALFDRITAMADRDFMGRRPFQPEALAQPLHNSPISALSPAEGSSADGVPSALDLV